MKQFELDKWMWIEKDVELMGWHDSVIHGFRLMADLELDIDYIFQWNKPEIEGFPFTFWISPATLIFEKPIDFTFELSRSFDDSWLEIENIKMSSINNSTAWSIITAQGNISFKANSYRQIIRRKPTIQFGQSIELDERGGVCFDATPGDKLIEQISPEIVNRRKKDLELYETAKKRFQLKKELHALLNDENPESLSTKEKLLKQNELKSSINSLNKELYSTKFKSW